MRREELRRSPFLRLEEGEEEQAGLLAPEAHANRETTSLIFFGIPTKS